MKENAVDQSASSQTKRSNPPLSSEVFAENRNGGGNNGKKDVKKYSHNVQVDLWDGLNEPTGGRHF